MSPLEIVRQRYTTKHYDKTKPLTDEEVATLLEVARLSPSSVNAQPWHFFVARTEEAKKKLLPGILDFNQSRALDADFVLVIAANDAYTDADFESRLEQETVDGRYPNDALRTQQDQGRRFFVGLHTKTPDQLFAWSSRQAYIALGFVLYAAAQMGIDSTSLEGVDYAKIDEILGLKGKGLRTAVAVSFGHRSAQDGNATRPKSCLSSDKVMTVL